MSIFAQQAVIENIIAAFTLNRTVTIKGKWKKKRQVKATAVAVTAATVNENITLFFSSFWISSTESSSLGRFRMGECLLAIILNDI